MNTHKYIFFSAFLMFMSSCKEKAQKRWTIIENEIKADEIASATVTNQTLSEGDHKILDYVVNFSNFIDDSRCTPLNYEKYSNIVFSKESTDVEIANKISILGAYSYVIHFHGNGLNKGFLIYKNNSPKEARFELWDENGIKRIRGDFLDTIPEISDANRICYWLSNMRW